MINYLLVLIFIIILIIIFILFLQKKFEYFVPVYEQNRLYQKYRDYIENHNNLENNNFNYNKLNYKKNIPYKISDNCFVDKYSICINNSNSNKKMCQDKSLDSCKLYGYSSPHFI